MLACWDHPALSDPASALTSRLKLALGEISGLLNAKQKIFHCKGAEDTRCLSVREDGSDLAQYRMCARFSGATDVADCAKARGFADTQKLHQNTLLSKVW
jgi:hypothetical protein